ncbi:Toxin SymE, type I toxin-antitoxin system [Flavobacterium sp. CF108]|jgi:toxic protein SymE|uniref:SymE family type I addiction module toxin n=1 Tax=unclassified Flavobacterium TaxID=196869 RepID=UPI0008AB036F|nr:MULTISPECIES: SymE family type I addiction module toxin [unclassified Flavobacterium]SEN95723.1 Toxin SymE, type I toxin-antitoxin system [Flavobacterium sp. fv08]SHH29899.1 Toxin SymE, type I toxin-antitoxin system [Flavobacterium sp. CF108]
MNNERKLKIHTKYQKRTYKHITIPSIKLEGKWLEKLGFKKGEVVIVEQKKNKLIITNKKSKNLGLTKL